MNVCGDCKYCIVLLNTLVGMLLLINKFDKLLKELSNLCSIAFVCLFSIL